MSDTPSTMLNLGIKIPDFELPDAVTGKTVSLDDFDHKSGVVVVFMCNHCPFVKLIKDKLAELAGNYKSEIGFVGINANNFEKYPQDNPKRMADDAEKHNYPFPYLVDESQQTAQAYRAACTPDIYLADKNRRLVYRGQFDDSRPGNEKPVTGKDLKQAINRLLQGKEPLREQTPSIGCNIKWKPGNEPEYYR